jgi:Uncharacterized conserved protein
MKQLSLLAIATLLSFGSIAQTQEAKKLTPVKYIKVSGYAERFYEPDYIDVQISLAEKEKVNNNNSVAEKEQDLLKALKAMGIPADKLRVQRMNTGEAYSMFGNKYYINKSYTLRIDNLKKYEDIILGLVQRDFKNLYISEIGMNEKDKKNDEVMAEAVKNGINKANVIAGASSVKNVKLISVDETNEYSPQPIMYKREYAMAMDAGASNIPLGKLSLQKNLTLVFEIE